MTLSRDKYVANTYESREKLVDQIIANSDSSQLRNIAKAGLISHYIDCDQHFIDDYYYTFKEEDVDKIAYYHGQHSNPCVIGEIYIPSGNGSEVIAITHNMVYEFYGDSLCDITKVWDADVQIESTGYNRHDTDYDSCIHIPLDIGEHTSLGNMILKRILLDNNVEVVTLYQSYENRFKLEDFCDILDRLDR
jgi:hypothetical protein